MTPRAKKAVLLLASILVSIAVLEIGAFVVSRRIPEVPLYEDLERSGTAKEFRPTIVLHPYTGFVANPDKDDRNSWGFPGRAPGFEKTENTVVVGIFGGSVAAQFCINDPLTEALKHKSAYYANKDIVLVCGAVGGFKQPQQLNAMTFLMPGGVEFDVVVNLDGLNEIAHQRTTKVSYLYPRNWHLISQKGMSIEASMQLGEILVMKREKQKWQRVFSDSILGHSNFFALVGKVLRNRVNQRIGRAYERLDGLTTPGDEELDFQTRGPAKEYDEATYIEDSANLWRDASVMMRDIAEPRGATYIHFLQPNRYTSKKKPTERERKMHDEEKARRNGEGRHPRGRGGLLRSDADLRRRRGRDVSGPRTLRRRGKGDHGRSHRRRDPGSPPHRRLVFRGPLAVPARAQAGAQLGVVRIVDEIDQLAGVLQEVVQLGPLGSCPRTPCAGTRRRAASG
jgi:hypothetical protein